MEHMEKKHIRIHIPPFSGKNSEDHRLNVAGRLGRCEFPGGSIVLWPSIPCASTVPSSPPCTAPSHRPRDVCRSRRGTPRKKWRMWGTPCFRDPSHKCVPIVACPQKKNEQGVPGEYTKYNIIRIPLVFFVQFFAQPFFRHLEN